MNTKTTVRGKTPMNVLRSKTASFKNNGLPLNVTNKYMIGGRVITLSTDEYEGPAIVLKNYDWERNSRWTGMARFQFLLPLGNILDGFAHEIKEVHKEVSLHASLNAAISFERESRVRNNMLDTREFPVGEPPEKVDPVPAKPKESVQAKGLDPEEVLLGRSTRGMFDLIRSELSLDNPPMGGKHVENFFIWQLAEFRRLMNHPKIGKKEEQRLRGEFQLMGNRERASVLRHTRDSLIISGMSVEAGKKRKN